MIYNFDLGKKVSFSEDLSNTMLAQIITDTGSSNNMFLHPHKKLVF